jgi:hypothetical protein
MRTVILLSGILIANAIQRGTKKHAADDGFIIVVLLVAIIMDFADWVHGIF